MPGALRPDAHCQSAPADDGFFHGGDACTPQGRSPALVIEKGRIT